MSLDELNKILNEIEDFIENNSTMFNRLNGYSSEVSDLIYKEWDDILDIEDGVDWKSIGLEPVFLNTKKTFTKNDLRHATEGVWVSFAKRIKKLTQINTNNERTLQELYNNNTLDKLLNNLKDKVKVFETYSVQRDLKYTLSEVYKTLTILESKLKPIGNLDKTNTQTNFNSILISLRNKVNLFEYVDNEPEFYIDFGSILNDLSNKITHITSYKAHTSVSERFIDDLRVNVLKSLERSLNAFKTAPRANYDIDLDELIPNIPKPKKKIRKMRKQWAGKPRVQTIDLDDTVKHMDMYLIRSFNRKLSQTPISHVKGSQNGLNKALNSLRQIGRMFEPKMNIEPIKTMNHIYGEELKQMYLDLAWIHLKAQWKTAAMVDAWDENITIDFESLILEYYEPNFMSFYKCERHVKDIIGYAWDIYNQQAQQARVRAYSKGGEIHSKADIERIKKEYPGVVNKDRDKLLRGPYHTEVPDIPDDIKDGD